MLIKTLVTISLLVAGTLINGFTISILWEWFVSSTFNLPVLSIAQALGLALVVSYVSGNSTEEIKSTEFSDIIIKAISRLAGKTLAALSTGWVVLQFI